MDLRDLGKLDMSVREMISDLLENRRMYGYYYRRFAYFPKKTTSGWIWFKRYYEQIDAIPFNDIVVKRISEEDYLFLKLQGKIPQLGSFDDDWTQL